MDTTEVRSKHRFNEDNLDRYLLEHVPDYPKTKAQLKVSQYTSGQSNPTFCLQKDDKSYVMRKKPPGQLLRGAHQINREYKIQDAVRKAGYPVPKMVVYCDDESVIGTQFYIMERVEGRIFRDVTLPGMKASEKNYLYISFIRCLAKLHRINFRQVGLQDYGKIGNYKQRQLTTWTKQYRNSNKQANFADVPQLEELIIWLQDNMPKEKEKTTIVHGDFRVDNMIFHKDKIEEIAVLDWELSTLGDPLVDLACCCLPFYWPQDVPSPFGAISAESLKGIPDEQRLMKIYCRDTGEPYPIKNWNYYMALSFFKIAAISQGVHARFVIGNASGVNPDIFEFMTKRHAQVGLEIAKGGAKRVQLTPSPTSGILDIKPVLEMKPMSSKGQDLLQKVKDFIKNEVLPVEAIYFQQTQSGDPWKIPPVMEELKAKAKKLGLWNLFLPGESGLSQLEYAHMAEAMGWSPLGSEPFNCSAPDTGNMEVLHLYGSPEQKKKWLKPLLEGTIRSCFSMTEPNVASSDATNIECSIEREGDQYVVNGVKWWSSGAGDPRCKFAIVMGKTGGKDLSRHQQHSMIIVPLDTPGVKKVRALHVFGNLDAPHGHFEIEFDNVRVPAENLILGEGRGFEIAQGRLGPGRIHHCMRLIGLAERSLELMCSRAMARRAFGRRLAEMGVVQHQIAECRLEIEQARLLVLKAAHTIDLYGTKKARKEVAMIKVVAPRMATKVIDRAIQVHGGAGVSNDVPLTMFYAGARMLRIADGPDEVHLTQVALRELKQQLDKAKL